MIFLKFSFQIAIGLAPAWPADRGPWVWHRGGQGVLAYPDLVGFRPFAVVPRVLPIGQAAKDKFARGSGRCAFLP